jgi:hypothetical protein
MDTTRDDLKDAAEHARQAAAATLKAMRSALDLLIDKLDGDAGRRPDAPPAGAARPGETPFEDDGKVL